MDNSHVIVRIFNQEKIEVYYFHGISHYTYNYPVCFTVFFSSINQMFTLLSIFVNIQHLCTYHKLYIGKEVFKANLSINLQQLYIQS
uniref:DUF4346 domain-containing protein n=1 Tax=Symphyocladiella dendroidea TaxID=2506487 RepID=A0A1Z1M777_9FLOR|nr:hypothetical protein [Symphyocladiella dendroidea]ARW61839.1 hypothetical protein [Symphyocladiella dendroidea]